MRGTLARMTIPSDGSLVRLPRTTTNIKYKKKTCEFIGRHFFTGFITFLTSAINVEQYSTGICEFLIVMFHIYMHEDYATETTTT